MQVVGRDILGIFVGFKKPEASYVFSGKMQSDLEVEQNWRMVDVRREN